MNTHPMDTFSDPLEAALRTLPLEPAPVSLAPAVLRRVRAPHFELPWFEAALSLFAAVMVTVGLYLAYSLSPVQLNAWGLTLWAGVLSANYLPTLFAALLGLMIMGVCAAFAGVLFFKPDRIWLKRAGA